MEEIDLEIPKYEIDEWISILKPYQREIIINLVDRYGAEEAINQWMMANGPVDTVKFGGMPDNEKSKFSDRFKDEINKFICGHPSYSKYREEYLKLNEGTKTALVTSISSFLGAKLGVSVSILAPAIVLTLYLVGKMGINAYCSVIEFD